MLSEELRRRIEALNRQVLPAPEPIDAAPAGVAGTIASLISDLRLGGLRVAEELAPPTARRFYDLPPVEHSTEHGPHGRYRYELADFWPDAAARLETWQPNSRLSGPRRRRAEVEGFRYGFPNGALFLDLETCGFAGSMVFLIGLVWCDGDRLIIDQLLARSYEEEKAALVTLQQIAAARPLLVTFNGKSFDWPMVQDRLIRHRLHVPRPVTTNDVADSRPLVDASVEGDARPHSGPLPEGDGASRSISSPGAPSAQVSNGFIHYDVLHHARRRWKRVLPNCKLQTLERIVCRRHRREDISGAEIPLAYHEYVRTGDDRQMKLILHHNAMDLVTLVQVALRLAE